MKKTESQRVSFAFLPKKKNRERALEKKKRERMRAAFLNDS